jgi:transcription-repair coupling factor (superfamily II helicase)
MMPVALLCLALGDRAESGKKGASASGTKTKKRPEDALAAGTGEQATEPASGSGSGKKSIFYVTASQSRAEQCRDDLAAWADVAGRKLSVHALPDGSTRRQSLLQSDSPRAEALHRLLLDPPDVFFGSVTSLTSPAPVPRLMRESELVLKVGDELDLKTLAERLVEMGYDDEVEVGISGEFARRGGLIDIFSSSESSPARVEFFGDTIESIRLFRPDTQLSTAKVDSYRVILRSGSGGDGTVVNGTEYASAPAFEYLLENGSVLVEEAPGEIRTHLARYGTPEEAAQWADFETKLRMAGRLVAFEDAAGAAGKDGGPCEAFPCYSTGRDAMAASIGHEFAADADTDGKGMDQAFSALAQQLTANRIRQWIGEKTHVTLLVGPDSDPHQVRRWILDHDLCENDLLTVEEGAVPCGFFLPKEKLAVLTIRELFALPYRRRSMMHELQIEDDTPRTEPVSREDEAGVISAGDLEEGDYAVHLNYGICRYLGLDVTEAAGARSEMIRLEFGDDQIIWIPVRQAHLVTRYVGSKNTRITLNRINSSRWSKACDEARHSVRNLAYEMLRIQAMRMKQSGTAFPEDDPEQTLFEQAFPFKETPDQLRAAAEIKADMESARPMDRLLCGDVGYGKTELAMRAACKCALAGRQTAMLVPTTVLAQQHYFTFQERFAGTGIVIEQLSRFKTKQEQQEILERLRDGRIDIVIGTHRLIQNDVEFKDLGLVVIDEEQRFGVLHKDRLKHLRATVDVLTMTATPIPRTLHMSLSGIRDLSTLMNAPVNRLPIRTVFAQFDLNLVRVAIERELNRGGQVYYLHNRVKTIGKAALEIGTMFPDVPLGIAHGQMDKGELEEVMTSFIEGRTKILVCTSIIESGIDIPNANTIIIERADRFGLAELYQLRGRVGRWVRQAYAYLFLPKDGILTGDARKRIAAIRRYTHLGAGFQLAMSDLEIRGAGNILGEEQSGQINAVGFHLYCTLLRDCVAMFKGEKLTTAPDCELHLDFLSFALEPPPGMIAAGIPPDYIESPRMRLHCYRRLAMFTSEHDLDAFANELRDRFGPVPEEVDHFLMTCRIRLVAASAGITNVTCRDNYVYLEKHTRMLRRDGLIPAINAAAKPAQKLKLVLRTVREFIPRAEQD